MLYLTWGLNILLSVKSGDHTTDATLGALLRRWRGGRTLRDIAIAAGTTEQNLSNWEKGRRPRSRDIVLRLDAALGARGAVVRAYDAANTDLAERLADLERRMASMEATRAAAMPEIAANADQIRNLHNRVARLADAVQRLADPSRRELESPPGPSQ